MKIFINPYRRGSRSVKALANALGAKRIKLEGSRFRPTPDKFVVNWGSTRLHFHRDIDFSNVLNTPYSVEIAASKLDALEGLQEEGVPVPEFTTDKNTAQEWLNEGDAVVCRTVLNGSGGRGICLSTLDGTPLVDAPLYTKYVKKTAEYRVHVFMGQVLDVQQKKRKLDVPEDEVNWQIRNHDNGWIFAREGVEAPDVVLDVATNAVDALLLDFGAVDVVYNRHHGAFVLEVNTAPGLEGTTLEKYAQAIKEYVENL